MSCPSDEQLAAAAAGEHDRAAAHADGCAACATLLAEQRDLRMLARRLEPPRLSPLRRAKLALAHDPADEIRVLAQQLPAPSLAPARRAELAAETLARADALPARRAPYLALSAALAAAAGLALVTFAALHHAPQRSTSTTIATVIARATASATAVAPAPAPVPANTSGSAASAVAAAVPGPTPSASSAPSSPLPAASWRSPAPASARGAATITTDGADFTRATASARDTIELRDGTISIDARDRTPVAVAVGDTTIKVTNAHVEIRAAHGVIVSAHAFAGSVERTSPESKALISAGEVWTPAPPEAALAAFRVGWQALHEHRNADALAAFERASDPVIAEEAAFWAAIAAQRLGDHDGAAQRFRAFLDAYPQSTRADAARAALAKLP